MKIKLISLFTLTLLCLNVSQAEAKRLNKEKYYQKRNCAGITEFRLPDKTRIDCLTDEYAIEYDFANKWAEAVGQSLHYARMTNKKAGIAIIIENKLEMKYYNRLMDNINFYNLPITTWIIRN